MATAGGSSDSATMSKELRRLIKKRDTIKASINSTNVYHTKFIPTVSSIRQLKFRLIKLTEYMSELSLTEEAIIDLDIDYDVSNRIVFEDFTYTLSASIEEAIAKHGPNEATNSIHSSNQSHSSTNETLKLPTISIPTFNGELENWASFIDTFNALFHNNPGLTNVQRLHYLKSSVSNAAADVIKSFSITSENYQAAYDELVKQYENKALTIQTHILALLNSPQVRNATASDLRKLHHHVISHVRSLKALGQPVKHWDAWLVTIICCHLDPTTAGEWQLLQNNKDLPTLIDDIEIILSKRIAAYEVGYISLKSDERQTNVKQIQYRCKPHEVKAFFTKKPEVHSMKCVLCAEPHRIYACDQFLRMPVPERKVIVNKFKLCFNCLNYGHQVASCNFSGCPRCGKRHNSRLHVDVSSVDSNCTSKQNETQSTSEQNTVLHARGSTVQTSTMSPIILATALIYVDDAYGKSHCCRAVLDSGSQLNFISSSCAQRLQLPKTNVSVSISGVGSMSSSTVRLLPCTISALCNDYQLKVEFYSLPIITEKLPSQVFDISQLNIPFKVS